ncbi:thermonuclease family protein [Methylobrevis pamukkalensis]|uniref:Endonuclease YhcR n=1 Tax=Methylobrevis pamukkalensis TaxID=1439726 RepID=A0A1E3H9M7_9HYPH|nr:thermonuclease family protein [Methylobrevis pamukkalensis]ODN72191.1 Endonuclease YhcR precursor [Methylobrevis pamukkalensis]
MRRFLILLAALAIALPAQAEPWPVCRRGQPSAACVVDGDTLWLAGEKIRLADIDAPEASHPACDAERHLAAAATAALARILGSGLLTLTRTSRDRYGRTLARVSVAGQDVGAEMVRRGLARDWPGRKVNWCRG